MLLQSRALLCSAWYQDMLSNALSVEARSLIIVHSPRGKVQTVNIQLLLPHTAAEGMPESVDMTMTSYTRMTRPIEVPRDQGCYLYL